MSNSRLVEECVSGGTCEICGWEEWDVREVESTGERFAVCRNCRDRHPVEYADDE